MHPLRKQVAGIRPFTRERAELPSAHPEIAGHVRRFDRTTTIELRHRLARSGPLSPETAEPTHQAGPIIASNCQRHESLPIL
jgi:hypothetical protein